MNPSAAFVAADASGNNQDGNKKGVYARRYDSSGNAISGEILVNVVTLDDQDKPAIGIDSTGAFVVTWASNNQDGSNKGIYVRNFDSNGNAIDIGPVNTT